MLKADDIKYVNLQLKVAFLLKNIQKFSEKFNIIIQEYHKLWINENFEFPNEKRLIDIVYTNEIEQLDKLKRLNNLQKDLLKLDINDINKNNNNTEIIVDENNEENENIDKNLENDIDFSQYKNITKKRKRKSRSTKDISIIYEIRNLNKEDSIFEVERIINHKIGDDKKYIFYVKWKIFDNKDIRLFSKEEYYI